MARRPGASMVLAAAACTGGIGVGCSLLYSGDALTSQSRASDASALEDGSPLEGGPGPEAAVDGAPSAGGGQSLCTETSFVFCDGFENGLTAWDPASGVSGGGAVSVDGAR